MKKLLKTITLRCFSVAANADIYFCTEEKSVSMDRMWVFNPLMRDEGETISILLVDPERGIKRTWIEEDYRGACAIEGNYNFKELNCIQKGSYYANPSTLIMAIEAHDSYRFTYVHQTPFAASSYAGTCTKV